MSLTPAQLQTLKADIAADSVLNAFPNNDDGAFAIAAAYNLAASPDYWVWKTSVTKSELVNSTSVDATTFNWTGNGFIGRTVGELTAWQEMFNGSGAVNPSLPNVRQAFADIFSGTGNATANRTHLLAVARRKATRIEKLFATGSGTTATPSILAFDGNINFIDVSQARNLP